MTHGHIGVAAMRNERLIQLRRQAGLTQQDLAARVGLTQSMIAHIEAGKRDPSTTYKVRLARLFRVSVEWLFYEQLDDQEAYQRPTGT